MPVAIPIAMAAISVLSSIMGNQAAQHKQEVQGAARAAEQRAEPWLKHAAQTQIEYAPNGFASALQGGLGGFQLGTNIQNAGQDNVNRQALMKLLQNQQGGAGQTQMGAGLGSSGTQSSWQTDPFSMGSMGDSSSGMMMPNMGDSWANQQSAMPTFMSSGGS